MPMCCLIVLIHCTSCILQIEMQVWSDLWIGHFLWKLKMINIPVEAEQSLPVRLCLQSDSHNICYQMCHHVVECRCHIWSAASPQGSSSTSVMEFWGWCCWPSTTITKHPADDVKMRSEEGASTHQVYKTICSEILRHIIHHVEYQDLQFCWAMGTIDLILRATRTQSVPRE